MAQQSSQKEGDLPKREPGGLLHPLALSPMQDHDISQTHARYRDWLRAGELELQMAPFQLENQLGSDGMCGSYSFGLQNTYL